MLTNDYCPLMLYVKEVCRKYVKVLNIVRKWYWNIFSRSQMVAYYCIGKYSLSVDVSVVDVRR